MEHEARKLTKCKIKTFHTAAKQLKGPAQIGCKIVTNTGSESDDFNLSGAVTISVVLWQSHEAVRINCTDQRELILMCVAKIVFSCDLSCGKI